MAKKSSNQRPSRPSSTTRTSGRTFRRRNSSLCWRRSSRRPQSVDYPRNTDLDPQLVWRGKDEQDWSDLVVHAPPLYIQEKVQPKVLIDDLLQQTKERKAQAAGSQADLFADFNGIPEGRRQDRVLPARSELVEPHDPRRLAPGHGQPGRARGPARQGAVHLPRPALRHQVQQQLPVVAPPAAT